MSFRYSNKTEHFNVNYDNEIDRDFSAQVSTYLESNYLRIISFFGITEYKDITDISLYPSRESYKEMCSQWGEYQDWMIGSYGDHLINFLSPNASGNSLESTLKGILHEYTHTVIGTVNENTPKWLHEGLANYLTNTSYNHSVIEKRIENNSMPTVSDLSKDSDNGIAFKNMGGYQFSLLYTEYIIKKYGNKKIVEMVKDNSKIKEIDNQQFIDNVKNNFLGKKKYKSIKTPEDIFNYFKTNIFYGWLDTENKPHYNELKGFRKIFRTSSVEETLFHGIGTCVEQVILQETLLDQLNIPSKMFCLRIFEDDDCTKTEDDQHMHCVILYDYNGKTYHMECASSMSRGLYEYEDEETAINSIIKHYQEKDNGMVRAVDEFKEVPVGLSFKELNQYMNHVNEKVLK